MDFIGLAGLIVGLAALGIAIYGIRDVREKVRRLIELESNLAFSRVLNKMVWRFVDPTEETARSRPEHDMHEFTMLVRALDPKETVDSAQEFANNELLSLAQDYVSHGVATWKPDMDENTIREMVKSWRSDKNSQLLKSMFGKRHRSIL